MVNPIARCADTETVEAREWDPAELEPQPADLADLRGEDRVEAGMGPDGERNLSLGYELA